MPTSPQKTQIALTFGDAGVPLEATMTSIDLVAFINAHRKKDAEQAGAAFPSKGFAKLEHDDFMRKVPDVLGEAAPKFIGTASYTVNNASRLRPIYFFPKREACLMAMSYSYALQAAVFDHMTVLEQKLAQPTQPPVALPDFTNPAIAARAWAEQFEAKAQAQQQLAIVAPKAQALDRIAQAEGDMCITNAAKSLGMQPKRLFSWMQENDWIYRRPGSAAWLAYQARIKSGVLDHKVTTVSRADGREKVVEQVLVTPKGLAKLAEVAA